MNRLSRKVFAILLCFVFIMGVIPASASSPSDSTFSEQQAPSVIKNQLPQLQTEGPDCRSLDIVFIIDQSGSMGGASPETVYNANDPDRQRKYTPEFVIDWLTDNALDTCPDAVHRIGIISFGSWVEKDLELSIINPSDVNQWKNIRDTLKKDIQLKAMKDTNPIGAFIEAYNMFDQYPPVEGVVPKRVIVFLTDGMPCFGDSCGAGLFDFVSYARVMKNYISGDISMIDSIKKYYLDLHTNGQIVQKPVNEGVLEGFPFDPTLLRLEQCLDENRNPKDRTVPPEAISACYSQYPVTDLMYQNSTYIYTMLLNYGTAWPKSLRDIYEDISVSHGGETFDIVENQKDIPLTFMNILSELSGVQVTRLTCDNFAVNPLVSQARMTFFKIDKETEIIISYTDANGVDYQLKTSDFSVDENELMTENKQLDGFDVQEHYAGINERFVVNDPYPGIWRIESDSCSGVEAIYETVDLDVSGGLNPVRIWNANEGYLLPDQALLPEFDQDPYFNEDKQYFVTYELRDNKGNIVPAIINPALGVQATATITTQEGASQYPMVWDEDLQKYRTETPILLPNPGDYAVAVSGFVPHKEMPYGPVKSQNISDVFQERMDLFNVTDLGFSVFEVMPISPISEVTSKTIHKGLFASKFKWPLEVNPIGVKVFFVDQESNRLPEETKIFTGDPNQAIIARWEQADACSESVYLVEDENQKGVFIGNLPPCTKEGTVDVIVEVPGEYDNHVRLLTKTDIKQITLQDNLFTSPTTYIVLLSLLLVAVFIKLISCIVNGRNPVSGVIKLVALGAEPIPYYLKGKACKKNQAVISRELVDTKDYSDLYRIEARSVPKVRAPKPAKSKPVMPDDDFAFNTFSTPLSMDDLQEDKMEVKLKLWLLSKQKPIQRFFPGRADVVINLQSGEQRQYSELSGCEIKYD